MRMGRRSSANELSLVVIFFNDTATTEIYTLSLHDALPISFHLPDHLFRGRDHIRVIDLAVEAKRRDRKSTRLNSSHANISYAVFCLKKKTKCNFLDQYTPPYLPYTPSTSIFVTTQLISALS